MVLPQTGQLSMDDLTEDRGKAELFIAIDEGRSAEVGGRGVD